MSDGLVCECPMALDWQPGPLEDATRKAVMREAVLLLAALNQSEGMHEIEGGGVENRRMERLEAKLDLALHLLARALEPARTTPVRIIRLTPEGAEWEDAAPPAEGASLLLTLRPSDALPLALRLPVLALAPLPGRARVRFAGFPENLDDALYQFVFRRHRQAIRARTG